MIDDLPAERPPNIVLMNCDDLGWGDLACYGSTANDTPNLDRLATQGMRFTDATMASPVCSPSRAAMLTGCYPPRIGMGEFNGRGVLFPGDSLGLNPNEHTIAGVLRGAGYATKLVGKWHCGDQPEFLPTSHGFDSYYGLPFSNDMGRQALPAGSGWTVADVLKAWGLDSPDGEIPPLPLMRDAEVIEEQPEQAGLTARYVQESVEFLRANRDRPFFLYLAHLYVHVPLYVQERFASESRNGAYGAAVAAIDWATGVLMHELETLGLERDTIVIFTSDNGSRGLNGGSNGPLRGAKTTTWEGGMRVPFIVRWPGRVDAGTVSELPINAVDLYPTLAALAGTVPPEDRPIDGLDLRPILGLADVGGPSPSEPRTAASPIPYYRGNQLEAVRLGRWKLHVAKKSADVELLFDLQIDPSESIEVDDPEVVAQLKALADEVRASLGDSRLGITGADCRPPGRVENPRPLTSYNPGHPYYLAEYDLPDRG